MIFGDLTELIVTATSFPSHCRLRIAIARRHARLRSEAVHQVSQAMVGQFTLAQAGGRVTQLHQPAQHKPRSGGSARARRVCDGLTRRWSPGRKHTEWFVLCRGDDESRHTTATLETRQRILQAAAGLFALKGYHDTKLEEVLDTAHVTKGAFFHHFRDREDLGFAVGGLAHGAAATVAPRDRT